MNKDITASFNEQINKELYSAYLYLDIANWYADKSLDGYANWFEIQAKEELDHAMLIMKYLQNNDEKVVLEAIARPSFQAEDFLSPLEQALAHEKLVTASINDIYAKALEISDYRSQHFLSWFIDEQGEEEASAKEMVDHYKLFGKDPQGLYALNSEYKSRTYSAPDLDLD